MIDRSIDRSIAQLGSNEETCDAHIFRPGSFNVQSAVMHRDVNSLLVKSLTFFLSSDKKLTTRFLLFSFIFYSIPTMKSPLLRS